MEVMLKRVLVVLLTIVVSSIWASDTITVSFQNGAEGYNGCSDTYIFSEAPAKNYGSSTSLVVKSELCTT